ncbi:hypothetical protein, partial [Mesorhizobium sp.]
MFNKRAGKSKLHFRMILVAKRVWSGEGSCSMSRVVARAGVANDSPHRCRRETTDAGRAQATGTNHDKSDNSHEEERLKGGR